MRVNRDKDYRTNYNYKDQYTRYKIRQAIVYSTGCDTGHRVIKKPTFLSWKSSELISHDQLSTSCLFNETLKTSA